MSVSGTPCTTYDDGFPKAHPSLPPSTRRSGRGVGHRRTLVELTDDHGRTQACRRKVGGTQSLPAAHESLAPQVLDPTVSTAERAGGGVGPWETRRHTSGQAYRQPTGGRWARQSDRVSQGPTRPTRPVDRRRLGRHSFELRHYVATREQRDPTKSPRSSAGFARAILFLGEASEGAVAPQARLCDAAS